MRHIRSVAEHLMLMKSKSDRMGNGHLESRGRFWPSYSVVIEWIGERLGKEGEGKIHVWYNIRNPLCQIKIHASSLPAGCFTKVASSSSGEPPMKKRRILGTSPFPMGLHVFTVISWEPWAENKVSVTMEIMKYEIDITF